MEERHLFQSSSLCARHYDFRQCEIQWHRELFKGGERRIYFYGIDTLENLTIREVYRPQQLVIAGRSEVVWLKCAIWLYLKQRRIRQLRDSDDILLG